MLLEEGWAPDALREALHDERSVVEHRQQERRHAHVIAQQLALGDARRRPEHAGQVRHVEDTAVAEIERAVAPGGLDGGEPFDEATQLGIARQSQGLGRIPSPSACRRTRRPRVAALDKDDPPVAGGARAIGRVGALG